MRDTETTTCAHHWVIEAALIAGLHQQTVQLSEW